MGVAGSGKTTLSRGILRRIWAVYLDNNQIADAFFPNTRMGADYEKLRPRLYKALYMIADENLKVGNNVLMDVPHIKEIQRPRWRFFIKKLVAKTKAKLITRMGGYSAHWVAWPRSFTKWEAVAALPPLPAIKIVACLLRADHKHSTIFSISGRFSLSRSLSNDRKCSLTICLRSIVWLPFM